MLATPQLHLPRGTPSPMRAARQVAPRSATIQSTEVGAQLQQWLRDNGADEQKVIISKNNVGIDTTVASQAIKQGETALSIPDRLCVTLNLVFKDDTLAELLTTNKLSELACLALYMMYEKKRGEASFFHAFIKELDARRGRGPEAADSPLLWPEEQLETFLAGSPVQAATRQRYASIQKEYEELDTVWFMAGSLFQDYAYEQPSSEFSFAIFLQAFCAVQSCVTHLQNVSLSRRFALVPLGPPLLSYRSTSKAMLKYNAEAACVQLEADQDYQPGESLYAWCGPQPNSRLLINYGLVDEDNPYDKLQVSAVLSSSAPLFKAKRDVLSHHELASQQLFNITRGEPLPANFLPYLRLAYAQTQEEVEQVRFGHEAAPISPANEARALGKVGQHLEQRLAGYRTSIEEDGVIVDDPGRTPRERTAHKLLRIEKAILLGALEALQAKGYGEHNGAAGALGGEEVVILHAR